jgi:uncharacterized membrane protein
MTADRRGTWAAVTVGLAGAATVGVLATRRRRRHQPDRRDGWYEVSRGVTVDRPLGQVADFWRDAERLGAALGRPVRVEQVGEERWRVSTVQDADDPADGADWRAEVTVLASAHELRWTVDEGPVRQEGRLLLAAAPLDRGTELRAELRYRPAGPAAPARLLGLARGEDPDLRLRDALRRAKSLIECGTVVDTRDDPAGRGPVQSWLTDAARTRLTTGGRA